MNEYFCVLLYEILEKEITLVYDKNVKGEGHENK